MSFIFSWQRLWAVVMKEFIQMKRDRLTFGMIVGIPLMQLILFGYAINNNPKHLPTVVVAADQSVFTRNLIAGLQQSDYFAVLPGIKSAMAAEKLLATSEAQFIIHIPQNFSEKLVRNHKPELLVEADATDPAATSYAINVVENLKLILNKNFIGSLNYLYIKDSPVNVVVQAKYNPEIVTQYNIVPGLLGVVLSMTMIVITSLSITRERERGTIESLLAMPFRPLEVMLGKLIPYIFVGYMQVTLILIAAFYLFKVPIEGSLVLLLTACLPFIAANLAIGLTFSTLAKNQLQAMQLSFFYFLPTILLSGFMFPFKGMPRWAQYLGDIFPLTHFLLIARGILLKGNNLLEILPRIEAIVVFLLVALVLGIKRYRQTLD